MDKLDEDYESKKYVEILGGKENIQEVEACMTRIRVVLKDNKIASDKELKELGAKGVIRIGDEAMQIIVGTQAERIADDMKKYI